MVPTPVQSVSSDCAPDRSAVGDWTVETYDTVTSTNLVAAKLPAWHAVRAVTQTAGRGRFQRNWVSDKGGLWLSAVLPVQPTSGRLLPLLVGLAVCDALCEVGIKNLRLRWPNDVLIAERKLAGLLIDQFVPGLAVAGIGINVFNRPEAMDPLLRNTTIHLAALTPHPPDLTELMARVLRSLKELYTGAQTADTWLPRLQRLWHVPRPVQLDLEGHIVSGQFQGVDATGRLMLLTGTGETEFFEAHQVRLLRDI